MKVAFLFGSLNRGGTEMLMLNVFRTVNNEQLQLIGIYRKKGELYENFLALQQQFIQLRLQSRPVSYLFALRKLLKQHSVQIVHAVQSFDAVLSVLACAGTSIKVCQTIHGFDFSAPPVAKFLLSLSLRLTDANIFVSHYQKMYYSATYTQTNSFKNKVVPNGIPGIQPVDCLVYHQLHLKTGPLKLLTVGNFNAGRDQLTLCRFALRLQKEGVNFQWIFAGKRIEKEAWRYDRCEHFVAENGLAQQVFFTGPCSDVHSLLVQADAFIYASEHDSFGIAVVEAMAAGVPVLVNDWPVMKEITEDGRWATLYKTKDEESFLAKFQQMLVTVKSGRQQKIAEEVSLRYSLQKHSKMLIKKVYLPLLQP